jgi:hypothetical protein
MLVVELMVVQLDEFFLGGPVRVEGRAPLRLQEVPRAQEARRGPGP